LPHPFLLLVLAISFLYNASAFLDDGDDDLYTPNIFVGCIATGSSVDSAEWVGLAAFKPLTDFCWRVREGLQVGTVPPESLMWRALRASH
jgi:hypothetical protein